MPSTGQPVIIKNKIVYGYMDKATVCRDMGREDYNDLTEAQQLNGDVYFIQGVDASAFAPTNSLWNKVGTTPLDSDLPADCSQAINEIKSNLTDLQPKAWAQVIRTAQNTFNIPIDAKEVILVANMGTSGGYTANMITFHIPNPRELPIDATLRGGYAQSATVNLECDVYAKTNGDVQLYILTQNGTNHYEAWSRLIIYYR